MRSGGEGGTRELSTQFKIERERNKLQTPKASKSRCMMHVMHVVWFWFWCREQTPQALVFVWMLLPSSVITSEPQNHTHKEH